MKYHFPKLAFLMLAISLSFTALKAQVQNVKLEQVTGDFVTKGLLLTPGDYQFEIANNGVDHEVGFVLVPKGKYEATNHIKSAYVKAPVATGNASKTSVVSLEAGEYEYFCPLNPTPKYSLTVKAPEKIKLTQTPGKFSTESVTLKEGNYQFEIANDGVDHEVGFVLVPAGQYDAADHIQSAYVSAPVATGKSSLTKTVSLKAGSYEFFCPLNPTEKYPLTVAADVQKVKFTQVPGKFTNEPTMLAAGNYQFEIANDGVDHEVGFVLVPAGKYDPANHIKSAYVNAPVANGKSSMTNVIDLKPGSYEYFCPLNPTEKYPLTVTDAKQVKFTQVPRKFTNVPSKLTSGSYQFEIVNNGVDHEVGFVLVPAGKYDPSNHIKSAYVKSPAATGKSSITNIIDLKPGAYEYFCPLNPTEKYALTVE